MSVIRVGSSNTYASGWDVVFGRGKVLKKSAATKPAAKVKAKATPAKATPTKAAKKKASPAAKKKVATKARKPGKSRRG